MTMTKHLAKWALLLAALLLPGSLFAQQNLLVQTTLSAAVPAPTAGGQTSLVQVASATSITAGLNINATLNSQNLWVLYVDREAMAVVGVSGTALTVIRGYDSTKATSHVSGQMVLYGKQAWLYTYDPGSVTGNSGGVSGESCTTASVLVSPWLNIRTGAQWLCSTITKTWVPGFNNPAAYGSAAVTAAHNSSTAAMVVSGPLFHVTGTSAMTSIAIPVGCNATAYGGCAFAVIPDAACSFTGGNNIAASTTCVANKTIYFAWDATNSKWVASY